MILDTSAIAGVFMKEPGADALVAKMGAATALAIGAPTLVETGIVLTARIGADARALLAQFVTELGVIVVPFGEGHWRAAIDAYRRFGKGRHGAALNFGDCLTYATAKLAQEPLLCTGGDFARTDLELA